MTKELSEIIRKAEQLTPADQLRLIAYLAQKLSEKISDNQR